MRRTCSIRLGLIYSVAIACVQPSDPKQSPNQEQESDGTSLSADTGSGGDAGANTDGTTNSQSEDSDESSTIESAVEDDGIPSDPESDSGYIELYQDAHLPRFDIDIGENSWNALMQAGPGSKIYQRATIEYQSKTLENIGVRLKGRGSFEDLEGKPSFKIRFDKFVKNQSLLGLRSLTLNNMVQDPSFAHERLAYFVLRQFGLAAPLCNSAKVYVNGEYYGLYANVQSLDKVFVSDNFSKTLGNLYDTTNEVYFTDLDRSIERQQAGSEQEARFELETNKSFPNTQDLSLAIDVNYNNDQIDGWWGEAIESILDVDQFLQTAAAQAIIVDWDGFFGARNNYKLYHNPLSDRFILFSWGLDQTFGMRLADYYDLNYCYDGRHSQRTNSLFFERCKIEAQCWDRYLDELARGLDRWNELDLMGQIEAIETQIEDAVEEDLRSPYSIDQFRTAIANLRDFATKRGATVQRQLDSGCMDRSLVSLPIGLEIGDRY